MFLYYVYSDFFVEAEDTSSNDDKDIFGSTYSMLLMKHETSLFVVAPDISTDCKLSADQLKLEANIDEDKGMLQI